MLYNAEFLNNTKILTDIQKSKLQELSSSFILHKFVSNARLVDKIGFDFVYSSSQIEGNTYSKLDTLALIEDGITANGKLYTDAKMILNLKKCFNEIMSNDFDISKNTLHKLHYILADDLVLSVNRGTMRTTNIDGITGSNYQPLQTGERLSEELKFLLSEYDKIPDIFEKAIYIHNNLCYLQYFEDCNKRTARAVQFLSMKNSGIMPLVFIDESRKTYSDYRGCMVNYYETGNHKDYVDFFIDNYEKEMKHFNRVDTTALDEIKAEMSAKENKVKVRKQR